MPNSYFQFKQFTIHQDRCAMKVTTDACLFGGWVVREIENRKSEVGKLLDIGVGTGLLSLMITQKNDRLIIDAIEIDREAAEQVKENINASQWKERINIINSDVRSFQFENKYDIIISNPPFYEKELRSATESRNLAHHSDELKLSELLSIIKNILTADGSFFILLPYKRNEEIRKLFKKQELHIEKILFVRQSVKHDYFRIMLKGNSHQQKNEETDFEEVSIWDEKQQYTKEFVDLLKDYYLYLE